MKLFCVYMHTAPNGKKYVGITTQKPNRRWHFGSGYRHNEYFYRAIKKYGWNNFKHEVLFDNLSQKEAEKKEIELIKKYNLTNRNKGYNIHSGGNTRLGNKMPMGIKSARHKEVEQYDINGVFIRSYGSLREITRITGFSHKTIQHCCVGDCKSAHGYQWKYKNSDKKIMPISLGQTHEPNVVLYHPVYNVETGEIFNSIDSAQKKYNIKNISRACRYNLIAGGYHWKYLEDREK